MSRRRRKSKTRMTKTLLVLGQNSKGGRIYGRRKEGIVEKGDKEGEKGG